MPSNFLREARPADAPQLARVHIASWRAAYRGILPDELLENLDSEAFEASWARHIANEARTNLVLEIDGHIGGFAAFGAGRDEDATKSTGELYALYLTPEHWGAGCGRTLWLEAARRLQQRFSAVTVWVLQENSRARRFYEAAGFEYEGLAKSISLFGAVVPEVRYRMSLRD